VRGALGAAGPEGGAPEHEARDGTGPGAAATVAVLGGGQLGRMLGLAGVALGLDMRFLDPSPDAGAGAVGELLTAPLDDPDGTARVARGAAVATYEWEGVPAAAARAVEAAGVPVRPGVRSLSVSQDRLAEKDLFRSLGIPTAPFAPVGPREAGPATAGTGGAPGAGADDLHAAVGAVGLPAVVKTRRGGYDGKGQRVVRDVSDVDAAWASLGGSGPLIVEGLVEFRRELSILAVRGLDGDVRCWPVVENRHEGGILRVSRAPAAGLDPGAEEAAHGYARALLDELDHVGVIALELFDDPPVLRANEMAPRVHNSGHWTIEGAATSQFENHLRAVLGWPLGGTGARGVAAMVNCVGGLPDPAAVLSVPGAHLHRYGKQPRPGRKVGHVTVVADDEDGLDERLARLAAVSGLDVSGLDLSA